MSATTVKTRRKMSVTTVVSAIILIASLVWALTTFVFVQFNLVRTNPPHEEYDGVDPWPYDINWAGGQSNWFENITYDNLPLNQSLPIEQIMEQMENVVFIAEPADPPQLWRRSAYDIYDGAGWDKGVPTGIQEVDFTNGLITQQDAIAAGNEIYTIYMNMSAGSSVGRVELPSLFPELRVIDGSFQSYPAGLLTSYTLETDVFGTLLFSPLIQGAADDFVLISYDVTYISQDVAGLAALSDPGDSWPASINRYADDYAGFGLIPTQRVQDNISQFDTTGKSSYEIAMEVDLYFRTTFELMIDPPSVAAERPSGGQETVDWFLERGGGLPMDFATAYTMFMRELGVPARVAFGYAVGDQDPVLDRRILRVRHMMFWAEVFVSTGVQTGEWIQVIPIPLPGNMGGDEIPENIGAGDAQLVLFPWYHGVNPWVETDDYVSILAFLLVSGTAFTPPEPVTFVDLTDSVPMGSANFDAMDGYANLTYQVPSDASAGYHQINATYTNSQFSITNSTSIYVVSTPDPDMIPGTSFILSDIIDVDLKMGFDNYTAVWDDTLHVTGQMTSGGQPVNGTELINDQMEIWWDDTWMGNGTIQEDGTYWYDIYVDGVDTVNFNLGQHEVWSWYRGETDPETGFPIYLPARSADNSTVNIQGSVGFSPFSVTPSIVYRGGSIFYEGVAQLLNGTPLVFEDIDIYFNGVLENTVQTNTTGGFSYTHPIAAAHPLGFFDAQVNWTSTITQIVDSGSDPVPIEVSVRLTELTIDSTPAPGGSVIIGDSILIHGYLRDLNGTGLSGRDIDIYWNGAYLGSNTTAAGGYYEYNYTTVAADEGLVSYYAFYDALADPDYRNATSATLSITVKPWDVIVYLQTNPSGTIHRDELLRLNATVLAPEIPALLQGATVNFYWQNGTGVSFIGSNTTDMTGSCTVDYRVPVSHPLELVTVWANFSSPTPTFASNESSHLNLQVDIIGTDVDVFSNSTYYHMNETAHIFGTLQFNNGTPIDGRTIYIHWDFNNGTVLVFNKTTDITGNYNFYYNLTLGDGPSTVDVYVNFTSWTPIYDDSFDSVGPLDIQLFQLTLTGTLNATDYHQDEVIAFSGSLTFDENGAPLANQQITISYQNSSGTFPFTRNTDASGNFLFHYNLTLADSLGSILLWAQYTASDPLWDDANSPSRAATIILYELSITMNTNGTSFHLNETIWLSGQLKFTHNNSGLGTQQLTVYWEMANGTILSYSPIWTDGSGFYDFYYNCSVPQDTAQGVTIRVEFTNAVPLWDDASNNTGVSLTLYQLQISISAPTPVYLDDTVLVTGTLTYLGGTPPLAGVTVQIFIRPSSTSIWTLAGSDATDPNGDYSYLHTFTVPPDTAGDYYFKANYTSGSLLTEDIESLEYQVTVDSYTTSISVTVIPLTQYLNRSIQIQVFLSFSLNGTGISGESVLIEWQDDTGTTTIGTYVTNTSGWIDTPYSGFQDNTDLSGIQITATFSATALLEGVFDTETIDLQRWATQITGFDTGGQTTFLITSTVTISGILEYTDGPTAYGGVEVWILIDGVLDGTTTTAGDGSFVYYWNINSSMVIKDYNIAAAYYSGVNWIDSTLTIPGITITVTNIGVTFTATPSETGSMYRDTFLTIAGSLQFDNGTPMEGYTVRMFWDGALVDTYVTDTGTGDYTVTYYAGWDEPVGPVDFSVDYVPPSILFEQAWHNFTIDIRDQVSLFLYTQTVFEVFRGDQFTISGSASNGAGVAEGVTIEILYYDGSSNQSLGIDETTDSNGQFSFTFTIRSSWEVGQYTFYVALVPGGYFDLISSDDSWDLTIRTRTEITMTLQSQMSVTVGESFTLTLFISDPSGGEILIDLDIQISVNGVLATTVSLTPGQYTTRSITVPSLSASGIYDVDADCPCTGLPLYEASTTTLRNALHVFTQASFSSSTPISYGPASTVTVSGVWTDEGGNPISNRSITINAVVSLDGATIDQFTTSTATETDGTISVTIGSGYALNTTITFFTTITNTGYTSSSHNIEIRRSISPLQDLSIIGPTVALIGAIIAVLLYLYFVKGMFRGTVAPTSVDIPSKLRNIKKLADAGKFAAAITLAYRTFEQMCGARIGSERLNSETSREYLERVLKAISLDNAAVEVFVQAYEEARFSNHEMTRERYEAAIKTFTDLYPRIDTAATVTPTTT